MIERIKKLNKNNSLFLFGPRGAGKSLLIREWLNDLTTQNIRNLSIDLLNRDLFRQLSKRPVVLKEMIDQNPDCQLVFIDEIQKIPSLLDQVHQLIEERGIYFILTGSSARKLKRGGANLLAGRATTHYLDPFSYDELPEFNLIFTLQYGLMPKIYFPNISRPQDKWNERQIQEFLYSYVDTYLKEEILEEQLVRKINPFRDFIELVAQFNGKMIVYSNFAEKIGVHVDTVKNFFDILVDTLVGFYLEPFSKSIRARQAKSPKFYLFDVGVKRAMESSLSSTLRESTGEFGDTFEHFLIVEIKKKIRRNPLDRTRLSYLRTKDNAEIDLIFERPGGKKFCIEIKSSRDVGEGHLKKMMRFKNDFPELHSYTFTRKYCQKISGNHSVSLEGRA